MLKITMKETTQLLANLRKLMEKPPGLSERISAYIIPSDDAHQSEYISARDERRAFISGFTGSAGTAIVTTNEALLWTDGRYYQQAGNELDSNWKLMKDGLPTTPTIANWLGKNLSKGSKVGVDPKLLSYKLWKPIQSELKANECEILSIETNLIDQIWENQPDAPTNPIITLDREFCGMTILQKWTLIKKEMQDMKTDVLVLTALDEIAYFLNLRGSDIDYNPVFLSYLIITKSCLYLFVDACKLPKNFKEHQNANSVNITVRNYNDVKDCLLEVATCDGKIWIYNGSSYFLTSLIPTKKQYQEITPVALMKAVKNPTEVKGFINSHVRDGVALCKYFAWLEETVKKGEHVDEISGADHLEKLRSERELYKGLSFATISASGPNGSVIHYHPKKETNRPITDKEMYLCDSGAQFLDGTTDVTRTMHFGKPTDFQKECYTRVLKGQLALGSAVFPRKIKGLMLDTIARKSLWDVGLDYGHGTGHGVGHFLNVHEGPMMISFRIKHEDPGLQENMFVSNEPGFYQDGEFGIRIEDIVQIVPAINVNHDFAGRGALTFKTVTMCPKQTKLIKKELLTELEINLLNDYHNEVLKTLGPILEKECDVKTLEWLQRETQPI